MAAQHRFEDAATLVDDIPLHGYRAGALLDLADTAHKLSRPVDGVRFTARALATGSWAQALPTLARVAPDVLIATASEWLDENAHPTAPAM